LLAQPCARQSEHCGMASSRGSLFPTEGRLPQKEGSAQACRQGGCERLVLKQQYRDECWFLGGGPDIIDSWDAVWRIDDLTSSLGTAYAGAGRRSGRRRWRPGAAAWAM
jgi:hypothetical protein